LNNYSLEKNEASKSLFFNKPENTDVKSTNQTGITQTNTTNNVEENKINFGSSVTSNTAPQTNLFSSSSNNTNTSSNNLSSLQSKPNSLFNSSNPFTNCSKPAESMFSSSIQTNQSNFRLN